MKYRIIGAGLAGLSAGYHLRKAGHRDCVILEKWSCVGGLCRSFVINGFTFDCAIHILYSSDKYASELIKMLLRNNLSSQTRESWIYSKGTYTEYPFQAHTYGLPVEVIKDCILGLIEARYEHRDSRPPENFAEWIQATFGRGFAQHFMIPFNKKVWTIDLDQMGYNWISGRVPMPEIEEVLDGALRPPGKKFGPNSEFWYPEQGGMGALPNGFRPYVNVKLNAEVTNIDLDRKEIRINESHAVEYDRLISTLPLPVVISLLSKVPTEVQKAAQSLEYNTIYAVSLGIDRQRISDFHWIYYPEDDYIFHRVSFPMNLASSNAPGGASSITAEIACSRHKQMPHDSLMNETIGDLQKANVLKSDDRIVASDVRALRPAYVIEGLDHHSVDLIHDFLRSHQILPCGRFGEWEYMNMDKAILSGKYAAERSAI